MYSWSRPCLFFITGGDVPRALAICEQLQTDQSRESCYTGVLMENVTSSSGQKTAYYNPADPLYTCKVLSPEYQAICYTYSGINFIPFNTNKLTGTDWGKAVDLCESVPKAYQAGCFSSMGTLQTGLVLSQDQMRNNCAGIKEESNRSACIYGTISHLYKNPDPVVVNKRLKQWLSTPAAISQ